MFPAVYSIYRERKFKFDKVDIYDLFILLLEGRKLENAGNFKFMSRFTYSTDITEYYKAFKKVFNNI